MNIYFSPLNILNTQTLNREPALGHSMNYHFIGPCQFQQSDIDTFEFHEEQKF